MTLEQVREKQLRQMASGIINPADPIWTAGDPPTVWEEIREMRDQMFSEHRQVKPLFG